MSIGWIYFIIAMITSFAGNYLAKLSDGYEKLGFGIAGTVLMIVSVVLWVFSLKTIPLSIGYVIWSGLGCVGVVLLSYFAFGESLTPVKVVLMTLITLASIGLILLSERST